MIQSGPQLVLFPTVASQQPEAGVWQAEVHAWCYETDENRHFQRTTANLLRRSLRLSRYEVDPPFFRERALGFVVDNSRQTSVEFQQGDNLPARFVTKRNGHSRGLILFRIDNSQGDGLLQKTAHGSEKISLIARRLDTMQEQQGTIHLPRTTGLSVVSDIDDTIKFSNVSNKQELLANTFLRSFRSIEGMPDLFGRLAGPDVCFHYISATPWQMYLPISQFLEEQKFPEGSIHLRKFALKDATILKKIFPAHKKKRKVIESLITRFPYRQFLLIGDTGEKDPEIYGDIARRFPDQVLGICLRNVSPEAPNALRFSRAFTQISPEKWIVYEDALRLEENFLQRLLADRYSKKESNEQS